MHRLAIGTTLALVACAHHAPAPAPAPPAAAEPATCEDLCTQYAVCYEAYYQRDYHGGATCVDDCAGKPPAEQAAWGASITAASSSGTCAPLFDD